MRLAILDYLRKTLVWSTDHSSAAEKLIQSLGRIKNAMLGTFDEAADDTAAGSDMSCDSRMLDACTEYLEPSTVFISSSRASTS